jgi:hypothetical protein
MISPVRFGRRQRQARAPRRRIGTGLPGSRGSIGPRFRVCFDLASCASPCFSREGIARLNGRSQIKKRIACFSIIIITFQKKQGRGLPINTISTIAAGLSDVAVDLLTDQLVELIVRSAPALIVLPPSPSPSPSTASPACVARASSKAWDARLSGMFRKSR